MLDAFREAALTGVIKELIQSKIPYDCFSSLPSKSVRDLIIDALNIWLGVFSSCWVPNLYLFLFHFGLSSPWRCTSLDRVQKITIKSCMSLVRASQRCFVD